MGNCYVPDSTAMAATGPGSLNELAFAAKDNIDVKGRVASNGSPLWAMTHEPASESAAVLRHLLDAGARLEGKTICDELCFSLNGENAHYGTPPNPKAPGRIPGGSSCGSAAAVAVGDVDFAIGSDTSGSVRIPASYCGIYGLRATYGALPMDGVIPLAASFDTLGWFARDATTLARVGRELLTGAGAQPAAQTRRLLVASDALAQADAGVIAEFEQILPRIQAALHLQAERVQISDSDLGIWREHLRSIQAREIWREHGPWIEANAKRFGPGMEERLRWGQRITDAQFTAAQGARPSIRRRIEMIVDQQTIVIFPSAPGIAPKRKTPPEEQVEFRNRAVSQLCVACLGGLPELSVPLLSVQGCPVGLSMLASMGRDLALLEHALQIETLLSGLRQRCRMTG
jgi:amidase